MVMPGDNIVMDIELITPIAIEEGLRFAIREGWPYGRFRRCYRHQRVVLVIMCPAASRLVRVMLAAGNRKSCDAGGCSAHAGQR